MFSGIITDIGQVVAIEQKGDLRLWVATKFDHESIEIGASVAHSGVCLTVVEKTDGQYAVEASAETMSKTTLGEWRIGTAVNLEKSLTLGQEIGGHLVYGHVDGVAKIESRQPEGDSLRFTVHVPENLSPYIASKGSVAVDGVSLTVNEVDGASFGVNIIAHTAEMTTFGSLKPGDHVNIEVDMLARYVARLLETQR